MRTRTLTPPPASGRPLLQEGELERLRLIALQQRGRRRAAAAHAAPGMHAARARGQGMDLHDTRAYHPGDDPRHVDWRATARSGKPVTKVFVEEHARALCMVIDRRPTMMFGTRRELKAATAARVAALLAFRALAGHEAVSGIVIGGDGIRSFPPRTTIGGVLPLLQAAIAPAPAPGRSQPAPGSGTIGPLLARQAAGSLVYLISDFHDVIEGTATVADYIAAGPPEIVAARIVDEAEQRMRDTGVVRLTAADGDTRVVVDSRDPGLRRRYDNEMARRAAALAAQCHLHRVTLRTIANHRDFLAQIEALP